MKRVLMATAPATLRVLEGSGAGPPQDDILYVSRDGRHGDNSVGKVLMEVSVWDERRGGGAGWCIASNLTPLLPRATPAAA